MKLNDDGIVDGQWEHIIEKPLIRLTKNRLNICITAFAWLKKYERCFTLQCQQSQQLNKFRTDDTFQIQIMQKWIA